MLNFQISTWSLWLEGAPGIELPNDGRVTVGDTEKIPKFPPMLRRRLNSFGRICAGQMLVLEATQNTPIVYCSRNGDISRTTDVLSSLAANEDVSAIQFSLAVHNAIGGLYSIQSGNSANLSAISALDEPMIPTLVEAYGLLQQTGEDVICLIADTALPEFYQKPDMSDKPMYCLAFLMTSGDELQLSSVEADAGDSPKGIDQVVEFSKLLTGEIQQMGTRHNNSTWELSRAL